MDSRKTSEFLHNITNTLDKKIFSLDKKKFEKIMDSIHEFAQDENQTHQGQITHEFLMLTDLIAHTHLKKTICLQEIRNDDNALSYAAKRFFFALIAALILYYIVVQYHAKLKQIIEELKEFGITVAQKHKGHGKSSHYYLDVVCTRDLYENEYYRARQLLEQAYQTHDNIRGWIRWAFMIIGTTFLLFLHSFFCYIYNYFKRPSQRQYEKWELLKQIVWQRKEELKKELGLDFDDDDIIEK
jgi:hypothetical protein